MKPISPTIHGVLDYLMVPVFFLAPRLFGFDGLPATISMVLAGVHLILTALTAMPLGLIKVIPFKVHGAIEVVVGLALIALPWILGFAQVNSARNFFLAVGIVILIVAMLTDWKSTGDATARR